MRIQAILLLFQHTAARRRLATQRPDLTPGGSVSTHSRPKAAGFTVGLGFIKDYVFQHTAARRRLDKKHRLLRGIQRFNTQPPEGGWKILWPACCFLGRFNTQPPEGGWQFTGKDPEEMTIVSTHSRPKAAGQHFRLRPHPIRVSTHSRPKAAGASLKSLAPSGFSALISLSS